MGGRVGVYELAVSAQRIIDKFGESMPRGRKTAALIALASVVTLSGCGGGAPAAAPPAASAQEVASARPTTAPTTRPTTAPTTRPTTAPTPAAVTPSPDLPPAPPVETWVDKGSGYQRTLDLEMRTVLIQLGMSPQLATDEVGRELAYLVCATLRAGTSGDQVNLLVQTAYPAADGMDAARIIVTAQGYCLDTFEL